jgi:HAE1 family hydrophobic/amphiphilic exporter-1
MQKLAEICIRRPVFASMIILALVVVGSAAYFRLGVDRLPTVDVPTVSIRTTLPGAAPEEMETEVSQKIEEAVNTVEGIDELRSISGPGSSVVIVTFNLNRNIDVAAQDIRDRVATVIRDLPEDTDPPTISKFNNDSTPVMTLALSGPKSIRELTEMADKIVKEQLERSSGVGEVEINGGAERSINLWIDADKLVSYGIPITQVSEAVARQNSEVPGGNVTGAQKEQTLRTFGRIQNPAKFNDLVITTLNNTPIRIRDIGHAEDGQKERRSIARLNGVPTVSLDIQRQSGANTVAVIEAVKEKLPTVIGQLPADVKLEVIKDQSRYIYAALHEINVHLVLGAIFASIVVLAFMRSWRSTIIAAVAIPASVIATFGMMAALHFTLNSVTMLALVLMVGVVIDDAIVVLENIFRFVEEKKMRPMQAARAATAEIGLAVLATTLSLVVIFIPVSFMSSISGRFLYQFGITAAVAVMVSLLVSFTLTPMMSARLLRAEDAKGGHDSGASRSGFYHWIDVSYTWMLKLAMRHRVIVSVLALGVIASSVFFYKAVKQEFVPSDIDEAEFALNITAPEGTSIEAMDAAMKQIEKDVLSTRGVRVMLSQIGAGFLGQVNTARAHIAIAPHEERLFSISRFWHELLKGTPSNAWKGNYTQGDVMQELRRKLKKYKELRPSIRNYQSFTVGGASVDLDFVLRGPELEKLAEYSEKLREKAMKLGGIVDVDTTLKLDKPELRVHIDRARAADLGVDANDIGTALRLMVGGNEEVSRFRDPKTNEDYDVQIRLSEQDRNRPDLIDQLYLPRKNGGLVQFSNLATTELANSPSRIDRLDRQRSAAVRASLAPGAALGDRLEAIRKAADELNMGPAYTTSVSGRGRELERTFYEFIWAFLLSVIFMYMILASQFESTVHPLTILLSLPLAVPFALLSLYLTGGTLNLYSALGILVLFGVVKKNSILQIDHMNHLRAGGMEREAAIIQGNRDRLRPILMTTLALVAGMLPLAVGVGPGSEERRAVAIVVIGGQTLSLLLTLLVTPVAYSIFDDIGSFFRRRKHHAAPDRLIESDRVEQLT